MADSPESPVPLRLLQLSALTRALPVPDASKIAARAAHPLHAFPANAQRHRNEAL